jgi:pSer/pThr/pTyr-binding forkhead associated (FHA) protein
VDFFGDAQLGTMLVMNSEITIQLVDNSSGRPLGTWKFKNRLELSIGRASDQNISVSDPYVSRNHAKLVHGDLGWQLISLGRHGIIVANQRVEQIAATDGLIFRLGPEGPTLKFSEIALEHTGDNPDATISIGSGGSGDIFQLDINKLQNEVQEITDGDYFQNLQNLAKAMRERTQG